MRCSSASFSASSSFNTSSSFRLSRDRIYGERLSFCTPPFLAARPGTGHCSPRTLTALTLVHHSSYPTKWDLALSSTAPNSTELSINPLESQTNHFAGKKPPAHLCFPGPFCLFKNVPVDFIVLVLQLIQLHLPQLPAHRTE